jgi:epsin
VTGLEEYAPQHSEPTRPTRSRTRPYSDDEDAEYRLAIEASKHQEEEDRKKRESRTTVATEDDDLAKAIKLSKEEEDRRRRELEDSNASSLFDDDLIQTTQPQYTGFNQGYQQGSAVDFFANPIDQNQPQTQQIGYLASAYTGYPQQQTGFPTNYSAGFGMQQNIGLDAYGQQHMPSFQTQPTGYNPYPQTPIQQPAQELPLQPGSNNPWATNSPQQSLSAIKAMPTGSNNPFASSFGRPQAPKAPSMPSLSSLPSLPEQKSLSTFTQPSSSFNRPQKELSDHEAKLNSLLASSEGMDTFGNTGQLRIPAQHTAPGTFVNSAGVGANRLTAEATGSNPFLRTQFTGMPAISYGSSQVSATTGPAGVNGFAAQGSNNPFAGARPQPQNAQSQDLIQF